MKKVVLFSFIIFLAFSGKIYSQTSVGDKAPDFTVELLGGEEFTLSDNTGKVVLIFFFGNGCPFCVSSGPKVQELYELYEDDDEFIAVGLDTWNSSSNENSVTNFQTNSTVMFPLGLMAGDVSNAFSSTYDRLAVIDKSGYLRHKGGSAAGNDTETASAVISSYLAIIASVDDISQENKLSVYPNPASDLVYFRTGIFDGNQAEVNLYDISGKIRRSEFIESSSLLEDFAMDVSDLDSGVYFYKLKTDKIVNTGSIVIR